MAAATTSSNPPDTKRAVDEAFVSKTRSLLERLTLENATLKKALDLERSGVRAIKAQHESHVRNLNAEHKKTKENLQKQLRNVKPEKLVEETTSTDVKKLVIEIQTLKSANKELQEKLKVSRSAECARAAEARAAAAHHAAAQAAHAAQTQKHTLHLLEEIKSKDRTIATLRRDAMRSEERRTEAKRNGEQVSRSAECARAAEARAAAAHHAAAQAAHAAQTQKHTLHLLEEIKSKDRTIATLRRDAMRSEERRTEAKRNGEQMQRMESRGPELRKPPSDQLKEKSNRVDLKTDIQHRKETFYRAASCDADSAVSSAPSSLSPQPAPDMWQCDKCPVLESRLVSARRDASRLADALRDAREQIDLMEFRLLELEDAAGDKVSESLTDSDSGCASPPAPPPLRRHDSGYTTPPQHNKLYKEGLVGDMDSEGDSLKSSSIKEHLEQMIQNASPEDRSCLEQVLSLLYNYPAAGSDDEYQVQPSFESKPQKLDELIIRTEKAIATVPPYSQKGYRGSTESLDRKPNILQESGIFEGSETETKSTQTDAFDPFDCSGELNTEIQRLNSIRQRLEKQGVRKSFSQDSEGLECKCVKLGKKHKQYYERRLKFLEGKISIYEAAADVRQAKLAERLQKEFVLENRVQELESVVLELRDRCARLEEDCCELEEIENDTRLHWQQLEMEYAAAAAAARDADAARECSRAAADRAIAELANRELELKGRERDLRLRLERLERAVPALIAFNVLKAVGTELTPRNQRALMSRMSGLSTDAKQAVAEFRREAATGGCRAGDAVLSVYYQCGHTDLEKQVTRLMSEKHKIKREYAVVRGNLESKITELEAAMTTAKRQAAAAAAAASRTVDELEAKIEMLEKTIAREKENENIPVDEATSNRLRNLLITEQKLKEQVHELERREKAYLEMLAQADDMWAEMEGGYKKKINEFEAKEGQLKEKVSKLESERDTWRNCVEPLKKKIREIEESESVLKIQLEKSERDSHALKQDNTCLQEQLKKEDDESRKAELALRENTAKFTRELERIRNLNRQYEKDLQREKEASANLTRTHRADIASYRKDLNRMAKANQELDTTNSELREEVESLEKQLALTQKALSQCKRKCDEKIKTLSHELSIKTEELEEIRSEAMRQMRPNKIDLKPDRTEYFDDGFTICTAVPKKVEYGRMHHSLNYISTDTRCSCPALRSHLVGQLIEDLFERLQNTVDDDLTELCKELTSVNGEITAEAKAKITNYLLLAISKELVRSIGDADAKTETEEWRVLSSRVPAVPASGVSGVGAGNAGVLSGAARLASAAAATAAARLTRALAHTHTPQLVRDAHQEVLEHSDVKVMEEQLASAIESIVNCPSCALGTNAIVWSTDV